MSSFASSDSGRTSWPALFWLVGSRRYRAAPMAAGTRLVALLGSWALAALGADPWVAARVALAVGALAALVLVAGRRGSEEAGTPTSSRRAWAVVGRTT